MSAPIRNGSTRESMRNRAQIEKLLRKAGVGGIRLASLMSITGLANSTVGDHLRMLAAQGKAERSHNGGTACVWGPVGTWAHHQAHRDRTARNAERQAAARAAEKAGDDPFERPVVHRIVSASAAPRLRVAGPSSVWGLAA